MTEPDQLDQQKLLALLKEVEPSWKINKLPPDPSTEAYRKPAEPRRAHFSNNAPFSSVEATGGSGNARGGGDANLQGYECSGNMNGQAATLILYGPPGQT